MTLVEMLVVLAIIAVIASLSVLTIGSGAGLDGRAEAKRLEARLQLAADQTMIEDRQLAISIATDGYAFAEWDEDDGEWRPTSLPSLAEPHELPSGIELRTSGEERLLPLGADASGQSFSLTLANERQQWTVEFDGMTARQAAGPRSGSAAEDGL